MPKPIPEHLKLYLSTQNYSRYTPEDQAVWRYIMRQLKDFLSVHAHPCYLDGLKKTGISTESIPKISNINKKLNRFGWGAIPVSGFIPPAAFMELQSLGYLPIASEMRSIDHIHYTPAPDIVHEAAGHAPIIINKEFSNYLKKYAEVSSKALISKEDIDLYEAIRILSDAKERPNVSKKTIRALEKDLNDKSKRISFVSEAGLLSRMNWWTAEYGLIGSINRPRIYGAGLLSSIGEARDCLKHHVRKIPLGLNCLDYSYDITEQQPQLFVTPSFKHLTKTLRLMEKEMAFRQGGQKAMEKIRQARTVNTIELDSGLQISGVLEDFNFSSESVFYFKLNGPTQLSFAGKEITGHGKSYHKFGYSSPLGLLKGSKKCLSKMSTSELKNKGIYLGKTGVLEFESGVILSGTPKRIWKKKNRNLIIQFKDCTITYDNKVLYHPSWGPFDMALGTRIASCYGGPADRKAYGMVESFKAIKIPQPKHSPARRRVFKFYSDIRSLRSSIKSKKASTTQQANFSKLTHLYLKTHKDLWLAGVELLELSHRLQAPSDIQEKILWQLDKTSLKKKELQTVINDGIRLAKEV